MTQMCRKASQDTLSGIAPRGDKPHASISSCCVTGHAELVCFTLNYLC